MALVRPWNGRTDKPPPGPVDLSRIDPSWSWVYESLAAAWLFNESGGIRLHDILGRMNGTLQNGGGGGTLPRWERNGALWGVHVQTEGTASGIDFAAGTSVIGDNFVPQHVSVETWCIWPVDNDLDPRLFSKQTGSGAIDHWLMVGTRSAGGFGEPRFRLKTVTAGTITHIVDSGPGVTPVAGDLVHVVWTYDGALVLCYINTVIATLENPFGVQAGALVGGSDVPIRIGNSGATDTNNEWDAPIYKVAIYDKALSPSQVHALFEDPYGFARMKPTLVAWPHLELGPISLMDSQQHNFLRDELDDDFTVGSDQQISVHDDQWVVSEAPLNSADWDVIAATDELTFDVPTGPGRADFRWEGAKGDEIEADVHRGDQSGEVGVGLYVRDQAGVVDSIDAYRIVWDDGGADPQNIVIQRVVAGTGVNLGVVIQHTFAKDTTQRWRVVARTMADRVRIYLYVDGVLLGFRDDTAATRWPVVGFCGIHAFQETANTSGEKTSFDNMVIRSTPLVYDDEFDYVTSDSDLDAEDDWTRWRGAAGTDFLEMNAANDRLDIVTASGFQSIAYHWTNPAPGNPPSAVIECDMNTGVDGGTGPAVFVHVRHDGGSDATAIFYQFGMNPQSGIADITWVDRNGPTSVDLLDVSLDFTPAFSTTYHVIFWAETIDASTVRLHLVIDDQYWTVDHTAAVRIMTDGLVGLFASHNFASSTIFFDNIRIYDSPPKLLLGPAGQEWVRLADDFTVGSDTVLPTYDDKWFKHITGGIDPQVNAANDRIEFDMPSGSNVGISWQWRGGRGDEIQADLTMGDQSNLTRVGLNVRAQGLAIDAEDYYRIRLASGVITIDRFIAGSQDGIDVGGDKAHTFAKGTTQNWRVWVETLVDRVRIYVLANGSLYTFDDTDANRITLVGFMGINAFNTDPNTSGVRSAWDNMVIRNRARAVDRTFARSPATGSESFDMKLAQPGGTPGAGSHTLIVRAKEV